ncbi:hypothetical protein X975_01675, partial [Stegodyphus mimosarum]
MEPFSSGGISSLSFFSLGALHRTFNISFGPAVFDVAMTSLVSSST